MRAQHSVQDMRKDANAGRSLCIPRLYILIVIGVRVTLGRESAETVGAAARPRTHWDAVDV